MPTLQLPPMLVVEVFLFQLLVLDQLDLISMGERGIKQAKFSWLRRTYG